MSCVLILASGDGARGAAVEILEAAVSASSASRLSGDEVHKFINGHLAAARLLSKRAPEAPQVIVRKITGSETQAALRAVRPHDAFEFVVPQTVVFILINGSKNFDPRRRVEPPLRGAIYYCYDLLEAIFREQRPALQDEQIAPVLELINRNFSTFVVVHVGPQCSKFLVRRVGTRNSLRTAPSNSS